MNAATEATEYSLLDWGPSVSNGISNTSSSSLEDSSSGEGSVLSATIISMTSNNPVLNSKAAQASLITVTNSRGDSAWALRLSILETNL